jgi:hypothetical protein
MTSARAFLAEGGVKSGRSPLKSFQENFPLPKWQQGFPGLQTLYSTAAFSLRLPFELLHAAKISKI